MPGAPSNIRFTGTYNAVNSSVWDISIIDTSYSGAALEMVLDRGGTAIEVSYNTTENELHNRIDTMNARMTIVNNSADIQSLFEDLIEAEENRFYIQIERDGSPYFIGKVIPDDMVLQDMLNPPLTINAIDGITDLKNIEYDAAYETKTIKDFIIYCLNKLGVSALYGGAEAILMTQTNLTPNIAMSYTNLFAIMKCNHYFYEVKNEIKKPLSCYDVLNELCGRCYCKLYYENGRWNFTGMEGNFENRTGSYIFYAKDGSTISGTSPGNTIIELDDYGLYGGAYRFKGAYNKVVLKVKQDWTNKVYGDGDFFEVNYPGPEHAYYDLGYVLSGEAYTLRFINNILFADHLGDPVPYNFRVKYTVKITVLSTGTPTETEYEFEYPFHVYSYEQKLEIAAVSGDRTVAVKAEIIEVNPPGSTIEALTCKFNYKLSKDKETDTTEFKAYLSSDNVKVKEIENIGSDRYGKELCKFFFFSGTAGSDREVTDEYKFAAADSYQSLELAITSHMLKYLRNTQKFYSFGLNTVYGLDINTSLNRYDYKGETFRIVAYKRDLISDLATVTMVKYSTGNATGITAVEDVPAVNGVTSNFTNVISTVGTTIYEEFSNVTTNSVTLEYVLPTAATQNSLRDNIDVFVEGVRWRHVNTIGTIKNTYAVNPATSVITFFRALDNARVIVKLSKIYVTGELF